MARFSTKVQVNQPAELTFSLFLDENMMGHWISGFKAIEIIKGEPREEDSLYRMTVRYHEDDITIYQKLIEVEPNERLVIEMEHPEFKTYSVIDFLQTGFATQLECKARITGKNLKVRLAMPFLKSLLENRSQWDYMMFKKMVEKQAPPKDLRPFINKSL